MSGGKMQTKVKSKNIFTGIVREMGFMGMTGSRRVAYRIEPLFGKSGMFCPQSPEGLGIFFPFQPSNWGVQAKFCGGGRVVSPCPGLFFLTSAFLLVILREMVWEMASAR